MTQGTQIPPKYHRYHGSWWHINKCKDCGATGLYEDHHLVNACRFCGGIILRAGSGIWTTKTKPFSVFGLFTITVCDGGYWKTKEDT